MATGRKGESGLNNYHTGFPPRLFGWDNDTSGVPCLPRLLAWFPGNPPVFPLRHQAPPPGPVGFISLTTTRDLPAPLRAETTSPTCPASSLCWRKRAATSSRCVRVASHYNPETLPAFTLTHLDQLPLFPLQAIL